MAWGASRPTRSTSALWTALLVVLLSLLPPVASAYAYANHTGGPGTATGSAVTVSAAAPSATENPGRPDNRTSRQDPAAGSEDLAPLMLCSAGGDDDRHGSGCGPRAHCAQEALLPNAPSYPVPTCPPRLVVLRLVPAAVPRGPLPGSDRSPDLHLLQVHQI
jgi:hypothetical protein